MLAIWQAVSQFPATRASFADVAARGHKRRVSRQGSVALSCCTLPPTRFIPDSLGESVPLFLKRECDRTLVSRQLWTQPHRPSAAEDASTAVENADSGAGGLWTADRST